MEGRDLPPLSTLIAFESAARHLSFRAAAIELAVTPSAISQAIRRLEDALEVQLFERRTRAVMLTDCGSEYARSVRAALSDIAAASRRARQRRPALLRVSMMPAVAHEVAIPRLADFRARCSTVDLSIETSFRVLDLESAELTAAVRLGVGPWPGLEKVLIGSCTAMPVCAPQMAARFRPAARRKIPPLISVRGREHEALAAARAFRIVAERDNVLSFETYFETLRAAEQGLGFTFALLPLSRAWLTAKRLVPALDVEIALEEGFYLVYRPRDREREGLKELRDWLVDSFSDLDDGATTGTSRA